jgi:hypothetical protein
MVALARLDRAYHLYDSRKRVVPICGKDSPLTISIVILQLRLYALYFLDKKVLVLMVVSFLASSACSAVIMEHVLRNFTGA